MKRNVPLRKVKERESVVSRMRLKVFRRVDGCFGRAAVGGCIAVFPFNVPSNRYPLTPADWFDNVTLFFIQALNPRPLLIVINAKNPTAMDLFRTSASRRDLLEMMRDASAA
jgi:hypothetical protein